MGPGRPWPVVTGAAVVVTALLAWLLVHRGGLLGLLFPVGYLLVCVLGVAAVHVGSVVVPALAPPVVAFLGLLIAAVLTGDASSGSLFLLAVVVPLADLFWWMLGATVACLALGVLRARQAPERVEVGRAAGRP